MWRAFFPARPAGGGDFKFFLKLRGKKTDVSIAAKKIVS
jgi:hypothetical protein